MARSTWGTIRKVPAGYEIRYSLGSKRKSLTVRGTKKDAERKLSELRVLYEGCSAEMTLDQFWKAHFKPEMVEGKAPSTTASYTRQYDKDIKPTFGDMPMNEIRPREVQRWLNGMTKGKATHAKAILSSILGRAFALDLVDDNVMRRRYKLPKATCPGRGRTKEVYTAKELEEIYELCAGEPWEAAFILAAFGGASREEAMSPMVGEIEEKDGFACLMVKRGVQRIGGEVLVVDKPKTDFREDWIVVAPPYAQRLLDLQENAKDDGWTWLTDDGMGNPMCPDRMAASYKRWFLGRDMRFLPFANLRNAYATQMHASGVDGMMVSKLLRHSQMTTTYRHYDRPSQDDKINAVQKVRRS